MQNIVVSFESDTSGIDESKQAISSLVAKEKELTSVFEKGVGQTNSSLKTFTDNVKQAEKATVGAFGTKSIKEYQAAISQTLKETVAGFKLSEEQSRKFFKNLQDEAKKGLLGKGSKDDMKQYQASLNAATLALKELDEQTTKTGNGSVSLKGQLRAMKAELANLDTGSEAFISLASQAAELEDRIGDVNQQVKLLSSDTSTLDAGIQAVQGLAGAFAAAQGAIALFGAEDAEVQQTLLKVNAAMSIMQGLQQVGALLDKNSALNIFLIKTLRLQQAASTSAVAVAETEAVVATEALAVADAEAAIAQEGLNVAMSANPAGVLILALGTLVGLLEIFIGDSDKAAKAQEHLNNSFQEGIKTNNSFIDAIRDSRERNKVSLEANNASAEEIRRNDILSLQEQLKQTQRFEDSKYQIYVDADNKLRAFAARGTNLSTNEKQEKEALESIVTSFNELQTKRFQLEDQLSDAQVENESANFKERLKNHTAFVEASVLRTREGSRAELVAQIDAIRAKENEELKAEAKLPGEIARIRAQAARDIQRKNQEIRLFDLNQEKLYVDARLQQTKEGSAEELKAKIDLLKIQSAIDIAQAKGNSAKILDIKAKEKRDEFELVRAANRKIADDALNANIAETQSKISQLTIAGADATNQKLLEARQELIEEQAQIERVGVIRSIDTAENKRIRIKAINDKELADKKELEKQKFAAEITASETLSNAASSLESGRQQRIANQAGASFNQRQKASEAYYNSEINRVNNQLSFEEERRNKGLITENDYQAKKLDLLDKYEQLTTDKTVNAATIRNEKLQAIAEFANATLTTILNGVSISQSAKYQAEIAEVQDLEDKKLITREESAKRQKKIRRDHAAEEKKLALFEAGLNMSLAISKAVSSAPFPKNLLAIAFATFQGLAQITAIASRPLPQLYRGTKKAKEGMYRTGELGQELMWHKDTGFKMLGKRGEEVNYIPEGARVFNHIETSEYLKNIAIPQYNIPSMNPLPKWAESQSTGRGVDEKKLAAEIGKQFNEAVKNMPSYEWNVDNDGLSQSVIHRNSYTKFLNKKYSSRK